MVYVGMDVHQSSTTFCFYRPTAHPDKQYRTVRSDSSAEAFAAVLKPLRRRCRVAFEVSTGAQWIAAALRPLATEVVVVNASQVRWLYRDRSKTDKRDARKLAVLLYLKQLPQVFLPPKEVSAWRAAINHRHSLVRKRTAVKNAIRAIVRSGNWRCPQRSLWTQKGRAWLERLPLDRLTGLRLAGLLQELGLLSAHLTALEGELDLLAADHPGVALLRTIPGIGPRSAEAIVAFGYEVSRFRSARQFAAYFGLTPRQDQSGLVDRRGRISKQGPRVVRWVLVEACWRLLAHNPWLRRFFERLRRGRRDRTKKAIVALARKVLTICFAMLRDQRPWDAARLARALQ